jgi:hypothetical protein
MNSRLQKDIGNDWILSPSEIDWAKKYLRRLEKDVRQWPWARWFMLLVGLIHLGFAAYLLFVLTTYPTFQEPPKADYMLGDEFYPERLVTYVDLRIVMTSLKAAIFLSFLTAEVVGLLIIVHCLKNWNRHIKNSIKAKLIRKSISESIPIQ